MDHAACMWLRRGGSFEANPNIFGGHHLVDFANVRDWARTEMQVTYQFHVVSGKKLQGESTQRSAKIMFCQDKNNGLGEFSTSQAPSVNYFKKRPTPKIDFELPVGFHPSIRKGNGARQLSWWISWTDVGKIPGSHLMSLMTIGDFLTWRDVIKHEPKTISIIHDQS